MTFDVVGWSGQVVTNGAGIKTPLLRDRSTGRYASATNPSTWHDEKEIVASSRRGLLTLRDLHVPYIEGGVVIYAGYEFIGPKDSDRLLLDRGEMVLHSVAHSLIWVGHMHRSGAMDVLHSWGRTLIDDAKCQLQQRSEPADRRFAATRAMDDTRRARFCVAREYSKLRYEMFTTMVAAAWILQEPLDPIRMDASIDLGERGTANLARDAIAFARETLAGHVKFVDRPLSPFGRPGHSPRTQFELLVKNVK